MCGISGIIDKSNQAVIKKEIITINDLITHRGPDDEGFFYGQNFAFGHRRLSIIDLSNNGHQPMFYLNNRYTITYNGEIYNYIEIRKQLQKEGYVFHSNTDTEVILASYDKWGDECVNKFNGMWAFALYDKQTNIIFCSRDRFGVKPFYYTEINGKFIFGSEIKQLLEFYKNRYVNTSILGDYLLYGLEEHTNETFFKNIYKLEQSHNLKYDLSAHKYKIERYFSLEFDEELDTLNEKDSIKYMKNKLEKSINLRLRSDVKVGTCLSGGLDSSSITAIAATKYFDKTGEKFTAIHSKSIEKKTDESEFARMVANHCDVNLIEIEPTLDDLTKNVEEVIYTQEEPFGGPSILMQYFVMKKARESNCIVMLDGQGGDETFFGYEHYYRFYFASLLRDLKLIQYLKEIKQLTTFETSKKMIMMHSLITVFRNQLSFLENIIRKNRIGFKVKHNRKRLNYLFSLLNFKNFQKRELMVQLPHLLKYEDKNSMRHSVETRLPFLDYQFALSAISINDKLKFKSSYLKYALRKIVDSILPKKTTWRTKKFGFEAPTNMWINEFKEEMIRVIKQSHIVKNTIEVSFETLSDKLLWKVYNIAMWGKIYKVKYE